MNVLVMRRAALDALSIPLPSVHRPSTDSLVPCDQLETTLTNSGQDGRAINGALMNQYRQSRSRRLAYLIQFSLHGWISFERAPLGRLNQLVGCSGSKTLTGLHI